MCCTTLCCGPRPGRSGHRGCRSGTPSPPPTPTPRGCAAATRRAVSAFVCQMGARISSTSALVTSETGIFPMRGKAYRSKVKIHSRPCVRLRQPACFCSTTRAVASAKLGTPCYDASRQAGRRPRGPAYGWQRLFPGLGEGDQRDAAEPELAAPTPDEQALNPASGSARLDEEVQTVAVRAVLQAGQCARRRPTGPCLGGGPRAWFSAAEWPCSLQ